MDDEINTLIGRVSGYEMSEWHCELFGMKEAIVVTPRKGNHPNFFWRLMQYILFGNRWYKDG